jgi:hypothetical protein
MLPLRKKYFLSGKGRPGWNKKELNETLARNRIGKVSWKSLESSRNHASIAGYAARKLRANVLLAKRRLRKKTNASRR